MQNRLFVPGIPFLFSAALSLLSVGRSVYWQDSGYFLAGVRDLGILYPHGFVLYLLSCKLWTLLWGFLDFTLAVHLFSSLCVAGASAGIALAAREVLRTRPFGGGGDAGKAELAATAAGCLAAAGFTMWSAALLAKSYALLYLVLALLLWRMVRAEATGKGSDFTWVAALVGLAWAAHPLAAALAPVVLLLVGAHWKTLGARGIAWRAGLSALVAIGPALLLPVLALRHPRLMFGDPASASTWLSYLLGGAFTSRPGVFGLEGWRVQNVATFFWQDFLPVGVGAALWGAFRMAREDRRLLLGIGAWMLPGVLLATLFRIEGQQDFWLVAAWMPVYLAVAAGLASIPGRAARLLLGAAAAAGLVSCVVLNAPLVSMRHYGLAEEFGRFYLQRLEPGSILILESDDALATTLYLQEIRGFRRDVLVVDGPRLGYGWYLDHLRRIDPRLSAGAAAGARAFAEANVSRSRSVYWESPPADLPGLVPAGPLLRMTASGETQDPVPWVFPVTPDEARAARRRERGIRLELLADGLRVEPEAYEHRWITAFVRSEEQRARYYFRQGGPEPVRMAAELFESAARAEPDRPPPEAVHLGGVCRYLLKEFDQAEPALKRALELGIGARQQARSYIYLAAICQARGQGEEAARYRQRAMKVVEADPELRRERSQYSESR